MDDFNLVNEAINVRILLKGMDRDSDRARAVLEVTVLRLMIRIGVAAG
jgi:hypothetical protein